MVYVHAHTRSTPPQRLRCPPRAGARHAHHQPAARPQFCIFLRHAKFQPLAASSPTPPSWRGSLRSGFLQQHRAWASGTLASSPQKRENRVIVHSTFGVCRVDWEMHSRNRSGFRNAFRGALPQLRCCYSRVGWPSCGVRRAGRRPRARAWRAVRQCRTTPWTSRCAWAGRGARAARAACLGQTARHDRSAAWT